MSSQGKRVLNDLSTMLDKRVIVKLSDGRSYSGTLSGFDLPSLVVSLSNATDNQNNTFFKVVINGYVISEILLKSTPIFDAKEFGQEVERKLGLKVGDVKVYEETGTVMVMEKVKVTEAGVEGSGPMAQRVFDVFNDYVARRKKELQK